MRIFLDADVIYSALVRDIFLQLAVDRVLEARWSAEVHREWIGALSRTRNDLSREKLERTRHVMDRAVSGALVRGYEARIPLLALPDPDDRHVLAAAIEGGCGVIVTGNVKDFPAAAIGPHGVEAAKPDDFLPAQFVRDRAGFLGAIRRVRSRLENPPYTPEAYLDNLARQGLPETAAALRPYAGAL